MARTDETYTEKTTTGQTISGIDFEKTVRRWSWVDDENGKTYGRRETRTAYSKNGVTVVVQDYGTRGRCGNRRDNAHVYQLKPTEGKAIAFAIPENAHKRAIEMVLGLTK